MNLQFGEMGIYRSIQSAETQSLSSAKGRQSILITEQIDESFKTVANGLVMEGQPMTVDVR